MHPITLPPPPADIGAPFEGGFYGGRILSHGGLKLYAVAWAPKATGESIDVWHKKAADMPAAASCWHSMDNTRALASAGSELAEWALSLDIGGARDWCLPARDVLELGYRHLKPTTYENAETYRDGDNPSAAPPTYPYTADSPSQTAAGDFRSGGTEAFEPEWYWSSTQYSASNAWTQYFLYGYQHLSYKSASARWRACRLILLSTSVL